MKGDEFTEPDGGAALSDELGNSSFASPVEVNDTSTGR